MPWSLDHIKYLVDTKKKLKTTDGNVVKLLEFQFDKLNTVNFTAWAKHFRNHYCFDTEIDFFRDGTGFERADFLENYKFPTTTRGFGPGIRAGDFGEILVADYLEYELKYWVPRTRYGNKVIRDESTKGTDLIGFKLFDNKETSKDILTLFEVKTQFSGSKANPRLQDAVDGSVKDELRKAESLNAIKQRLFDKGKTNEAKSVARFQNPLDKPFTEHYGAAALFCASVYDELAIKSTKTSGHPSKSHLFLIVIYAKDFMKLVNKLYKTAKDEA
jgi:hypothetical protein